MLIFDIETEPLPEDQLRQVADPFDPATFPHPGEFDPGGVRLGNIKDPAKRRAKIEKARAEHAKAVADYEQNLAQAEADHWTGIRDRAALCATTGRVCAIGYRNARGALHVDHALEIDEAEMLARFWAKFETCRTQGRSLVGFNSNRFDVPFIARRSWACGVSVPDALLTPTGWLNPSFVDLMTIWQCGDRRASVSLGKACAALGIQHRKPTECTGADFHRMLRGSDEESAIALQYLVNDLEMTFALAEKLVG